MMINPLRLALLLVVFLGTVGCGSPPQNTAEPAPAAEAPQPDQQTLPKVLIIGDSISGGYTKTVIAELQGIAEVSRIPGNGEWTGTGIEKIDQWLGDTDWDVIHFNWGLWDMYGWRYYDQDRSPQAYEARLEQLVIRLKQTDAKLIWATTTPPCPENEVSMRDRFKQPGVITPQVERQYLAAAERVMKRHDVQINDLNALVRDDLDTLLTGPDNVHYTGAGYALLGRQVADAIQAALAEERSGAARKP